MRRTRNWLIVSLVMSVLNCGPMPHDPICIEEVCRPHLNLLIIVTELPPGIQVATVRLRSRHTEEQCFVDRTQHPPVQCEYRVSVNLTRFRFTVGTTPVRPGYPPTCAIDPARLAVFRWEQQWAVETVVDPQTLACYYLATRRHQIA